MRLVILAVLLVMTGCSTKPAEQTNGEVVQWLNSVPHGTITGVMKWESPEERARTLAFDLDAWVAEGRSIPHVESVLRTMLKNSDTNVYPSRVAFALGKVGNAESVPVLIDCLNSQDSFLRITAAYALGNLRDTRAVDALGTRLMLVAEREIEESMLTAIIAALDDIKDQRALEYMRKAADGGDPFVSQVAGELLDSQQQVESTQSVSQ